MTIRKTRVVQAAAEPIKTAPESSTTKLKGPSGDIEVYVDYPYGVRPRIRVLAMVERVDKKGAPMETLGYTALVNVKVLDLVVSICHDELRYTPCRPYKGRDKAEICQRVMAEVEAVIIASPEVTEKIRTGLIRDAESEVRHAMEGLKRAQEAVAWRKQVVSKIKAAKKLQRQAVASPPSPAKMKNWF